MMGFIRFKGCKGFIGFAWFIGLMRFIGFMWFIRFGRFARVAAIAFVAAAALAAGVIAQQPWNRDFGEDIERLVPILELRTGQTVADIGAGGGELSVLLAQRVGPEGRVYATEIETGRMERIRQRAKESGLENVTVLEAHATRTNLPEGCCDAIVIRNVYHHFDDPAAMNKSLFASVKPGGRLAIIDFSPRRGSTASSPADRDEDSHGVDAETVAKEVTAAGFEREKIENSNDRSFLAVFRKLAAPEN